MNTVQISFSPPDITQDEINEVVNTLKSGWITTGPKTKLFEKKIAEYCRTPRAVCLNSATACMEMALRYLGIGPGDEVITTAYTYTASASVVSHVGAKLVLVDTKKYAYEMDYSDLRNKITKKTKVIIPVDLAGIICDYNTIYKIVNEKKDIFCPKNTIQRKIGRIVICADGAHAFGAERDGKRCGEIADFTSFSFHAVKNLTTGEGGALTWRHIDGIDDESIYKELMLLSLHGQSKDALEKTKLGAWEYDIIGTYYKCNMTDIMASIGLAQMRRYPQILSRRREIIEMYNWGLADMPIKVLPHYTNTVQSSGHLYIIRINGKNRSEVNEIIKRMAYNGVAANVHYKPLPMLSAYKKMGFDIKNYPNAAALFENTLTLPLHTKLSDRDVGIVINTFKQSLTENQRNTE